jgi:hypothetical protein
MALLLLSGRQVVGGVPGPLGKPLAVSDGSGHRWGSNCGGSCERESLSRRPSGRRQ